MPCYDSSNDDDARENKKRLDQVTDMLCWLITNNQDVIRNVRPDILKWWQEHQAADALINAAKESK